MVMAEEEKATIRQLVEKLLPVYERLAGDVSQSLTVLRSLAVGLGVPVREMPQPIEELYDLVDQAKLAVTTTEGTLKTFPKDFKVMKATAETANVQVDLKNIDENSYKVVAGTTYTVTRKERKVEEIHYKGSGSATLWLTFWK